MTHLIQKGRTCYLRSGELGKLEMAGENGRAEKAVASFPNEADAKTYAENYAKATKSKLMQDPKGKR